MQPVVYLTPCRCDRLSADRTWVPTMVTDLHHKLDAARTNWEIRPARALI
jgi:hypothetical protein